MTMAQPGRAPGGGGMMTMQLSSSINTYWENDAGRKKKSHMNDHTKKGQQ